MFPRTLVFIGSIFTFIFFTGCTTLHHHNLPPAERLHEPGPGVGGPGPGVHLPPSPGPFVPGFPGVPVDFGTAQLLFVGPDSMQVRWDVGTGGHFDSFPLVSPGRQNFPQGGIYRLKLTDVPGRAGIELYPTIEVGYTTPRTKAFLTHNAIPIQFTEEDFDQVLSNNFVTKVIYLPDPDFQDPALAGVETLVSTRLDPGVDPIVEADRRGAILAIVRVGNVDLEMPGAGHEDGRVIHEGVAQASHSVAPASHGHEVAPGYPAGPGRFVGPGPYAGPGMMGNPGLGQPTPFQPSPPAPPYVTGVTTPHYGMPITGTPIGLPGPPHIPLGRPAGLQKHTMVNHTHLHIPDPSRNLRVDVKHQPGLSYPMPATNIKIKEHLIHPAPRTHKPRKFKFLP